MELIRDENKRNSSLVTAGITSLLFILFLFFGLTVEHPRPKGTLTINFGTSDVGSGEDQPQEITSSTDSPNEAETEVEAAASEASHSEQEILTANDNVVEAPETTDNTTSDSQNNTESTTDSETNALEDAIAQSANQSNHIEGETDEAGDQGDINGDLNGSHQTGFTDGNVSSPFGPYRGKVNLPKQNESACPNEGVVALDFIVNRQGKIIETKINYEKSKTLDDCCVKKAKSLAKEIEFDKNDEAPPRQQITILINIENKP